MITLTYLENSIVIIIMFTGIGTCIWGLARVFVWLANKEKK